MNSTMLSYPSEIARRRLYLGNAIHSGNAKILQDLHITHIINVSRLMANVFEHKHAVAIVYYRIPIGDTAKAKIEDHFETSFQYIERVLSDDSCRILVHCQHGISRSASIVIAYLIKKHTWTYAHSLAFVKKRRRSATPNKSFAKKLALWETDVFKARSSS